MKTIWTKKKLTELVKTMKITPGSVLDRVLADFGITDFVYTEPDDKKRMDASVIMPPQGEKE